MRLITFRTALHGSSDRVGALVGNDGVVDLTAAGGWSSLLALIEGAPDEWDRARGLAASTSPTITLADITLRAPIPLPPQYRDAMLSHQHIRQSMGAGGVLRARWTNDAAQIAAAEAARADFPVPEVHHQFPVYYKGNRFAVSGPGEDIPWPRSSQLMDFELELACVIGVGGKDIVKADAMKHVFGFMVFNDFSARDLQGREMGGSLGPAKGKDFDKANAFGPCLVTLDEIGDPHALRMQARVNGETWCDNNSSSYHWGFDDLIARVSADETLHPGEILASGTVGNGCGLEHLRFLEDGDVVELEIEKIGILRNRVVKQQLLAA